MNGQKNSVNKTPCLGAAFFFFLEVARRPVFPAFFAAALRRVVFRAGRLELLVERELVLRPAMILIRCDNVACMRYIRRLLGYFYLRMNYSASTATKNSGTT